MGNTDSIPVISQLKSLLLVLVGEVDRAKKTQENFAYRNVYPVLSQIVSLVHVIVGDPESALKVQEDFVENMSNVADAIPLVGHIKGGIHYAAGDNEGGDEAMKSASRSAGVIAAGLGGTLVGGPAVGVALGIGAGIGMDGIISGSDGLINGDEAKLSGYFRQAKRMYEKELNGETLTTEDFIDALTIPLMDGIASYNPSPSLMGPTALQAAKNIKGSASGHGDPQKTKFKDALYKNDN